MTQKKLARSTVVNYDSEAEAAYCVTLQKDLKNDVAAAAAEGNVAFDRAGVGSDLLTGRIRFARRRFLKGGKKMRQTGAAPLLGVSHGRRPWQHAATAVGIVAAGREEEEGEGERGGGDVERRGDGGG